MRTTLAWVTVTLNTKQYQSPDHPDDKTIQHIDVENVVTGGVQGTSEFRITDWKKRERNDTIFGRVEGQSQLFRGAAAKDGSGKVRPNVEVQTTIDDEKIGKFLRGEITADGAEVEGFLVDPVGDGFGEGQGLWLQSYVKSLDSSWTAEQIWGFEAINGERYHTRRVVVANNGEYVLARLVYTSVPPSARDENDDDEDDDDDLVY
ncbi:hypothetical protein BJX76DRAFT_16479 [Aspergillus varians]